MKCSNILILGGTGAMGKPLVDILAEKKDAHICVTTRSKRENKGNIKYIVGNARDDEFMKHILKSNDWDVIIDFMAYSTKEFERRYESFLENCKQYVFISSCRVYAKSDAPITEKTDRLLDVCKDAAYLNTDEYALSKARQENLLFESEKKNFTIIRPSITYNSHRLQLGVLEKEHWLYRAMHGRTIVFSKDIADKLTAMTTGYDVALAIANVIGEETALGEVFHITSPNSYKWSDVLKIYIDVLEECTGKKQKVLFTEKSTCFNVGWNMYQIIYCRYFNRTFDNSKISEYYDARKFQELRSGIRQCLSEFLSNPHFGNIMWDLEAVNDKVCKEWTPLREIHEKKNKVIYLCYRLGISSLYRLGLKVWNQMKKHI